MFSRDSAEQVLAEHAVAFGKHCNIAARVGALVAKKTCSFTLSNEDTPATTGGRVEHEGALLYR